jgi:shikimate 5-dehydrogenase
VAARRTEAAAAAAALAEGETVEWDERADAAAAASLVVNATPVGMGPDGMCPEGARVLPASALRRGQVICDLVYHPLRTAWLTAADAVGARTVDGPGMLIHHAALQIRHGQLRHQCSCRLLRDLYARPGAARRSSPASRPLSALVRACRPPDRSS